jgi:hypothetical protein
MDIRRSSLSFSARAGLPIGHRVREHGPRCLALIQRRVQGGTAVGLSRNFAGRESFDTVTRDAGKARARENAGAFARFSDAASDAKPARSSIDRPEK